MKLLILACVLCSVGALSDLNDEQKTRLRGLKELCIQETGVEPAVIQLYASESRVLPENEEKFGCFSSCFLQKMGIFNAEGQIQDQVFRSKVPASFQKERVDQIIDHCSKLGGRNLCEAGGRIVKCFTEEKAFNIIY